MEDDPQVLIEKINVYNTKLEEYLSQLLNKLGIWYNADLSDTYFSVIPRDLLTILKRMVKIYVLSTVSSYKPKSYCPVCGCFRRGSLIYYDSDRGASGYVLGKGRLLLYDCEPCRITYAVSDSSTDEGCVKLDQCAFIEITKGKDRERIYNHIVVGGIQTDVYKIVTDIGVFTR